MKRSQEKEIIDLRKLTPEETDSVYGWMGAVNQYLGGRRVILRHLEAFSKNWAADQMIKILDAGAGGSDIPAAIVRWARLKKKKVKIIALDLDLQALLFGKQKYSKRRRCELYSPPTKPFGGDIKNLPSPKVSVGIDRSLFWVQASCLKLPFAEKSFDYVIASMFFHHLPGEIILQCLHAFDGLAARGILINDLYRSRLAYAGFWLLSLPLPDPIFRHDGLLSIRRGFRPAELREWIQNSGLTYLSVFRHFAFRVALAGDKTCTMR